MTVKSALREGYSILFYAEVDTPMLDATVLLAEAMSFTKEELFASFPEEIDATSYERFKGFVDLRCKGIPVSYIIKRKEFYGIEFYVDDRVLVPRPDTEILVEEAISILKKWLSGGKILSNRDNLNSPRLLDLCTGSGCIAISIKANIDDVEIHASDISAGSKEVFEINETRILGDRKIPFFLSDLFKNLSGRYDIIVSNPPYLTDREVENLTKIKWVEPEIALKGGADGTDIAVSIIEDAPHYLNRGGYLMLEAAPQQMTKLWAVMSAAGFSDMYIRRDLGKRERVICGRYYG